MPWGPFPTAGAELGIVGKKGDGVEVVSVDAVRTARAGRVSGVWRDAHNTVPTPATNARPATQRQGRGMELARDVGNPRFRRFRLFILLFDSRNPRLKLHDR